MTTRRAFLGRLARGVVALYVAPAALEALAAGATVERGRDGALHDVLLLMHQVYRDQIIAQFRSESAVMQIFRPVAEPIPGEPFVHMTFPLSFETRPRR